MGLVTAEMEAIQNQIFELKAKLAEMRQAQASEPVGDFTFETPTGPIALTELFGDRNDLLLVHNMGKGCPYCTLWADGLNGLAPEISSRAAFALVTPNPVETADAFARERGWRFPVLSDPTRAFGQAMGFYSPEHGVMPGVSAFHREPDGTISRVSWSYFGPGDDFCAVWPLFDLLKDGASGWEPDYRL